MAKNISFNVSVHIQNEGMLYELGYRTKHMAPAYEAIFHEWAELNVQKFEQSVGSELSGAQIWGEEWAPVTATYFKEKHQEGSTKVTKKMKRGGNASFEGAFPNWLMVRTGALRAAMIDPDQLFNAIEDDQAVFGKPINTDLANIVMWQAGEKQKHRNIVFLSDPDMNAIRRIIQDYLSMGGDFAELRSAKALEAIGYAPVDALGMEVDFDSGNLDA